MSKEKMIVYTPRLEGILKQEFVAEATPEFLSLVRAAIAAHEYAFQKSETTKEEYLQQISEVWDVAGQIEAPNLSSKDPLAESVFATYNHASKKYGITKEKYLEWIGEAWDAGKYQRKVYGMEVEGCVNNYIGVAFDFGASLALWGKEKGYIIRTDEE